MLLWLVDLAPAAPQDMGTGGLASELGGACPHAGVDIAMLSGESATEFVKINEV